MGHWAVVRTVDNAFQARILYGVMMNPFTAYVIPLEDHAFFSFTVLLVLWTSVPNLMVRCFYPRLCLFALTCCDVGYQREAARWGEMFVDRRRRVFMWSICLNCTVISTFYLKNWEVFFKCIYRRCCQSVCLSTAPAVLIYRQLYLVVMLFLGSKRRVCLAERKIGGTLWLALGLRASSLLFILPFTFLLRCNIFWQCQSPPEPL